ncbi:MAG: hypothetical protein UX54_C0027G0002 [Parcubacteria group bacterium GW2011_GWA2_46_39]|nr:MAG: hypothetical protein UX54_C0027G0002 [Parcubacteria group bacterium GW2011_GWA2_46_39]
MGNVREDHTTAAIFGNSCVLCLLGYHFIVGHFKPFLTSNHFKEKVPQR